MDNFEEKAFGNVGGKLKGFAKWMFIILSSLEVFAGVILFFYGCADDEVAMEVGVPIGLGLMLVTPWLNLIPAWFLYAFGELVDSTVSNESTGRSIKNLLMNIKDDIKKAPASQRDDSSAAERQSNNNSCASIPTVAKISGGVDASTLIKRAMLFIEEEKWAEADAYFEGALDVDPENAQAYLGKLMAELKVKKLESLKYCAQPFDANNNYQKAIRFADDELKATLEGYTEYIKNRNENARLESAYNGAKSTMESAKDESAYKFAASVFKSISGYKDSDELAEQCLEKAEISRKDAILDLAKYKMSVRSASACEEAAKMFSSIPGWRDADELAKQCIENAEIARKDAVFYAAKSKISSYSINSCEDAIKLFSSISGWKDADEQIVVCQNIIANIKAKQEAARIAEKKRKKRNKIIAAITIPLTCILVIFLIVLFTYIIPEMKYNDAIALVEAESYKDAISVFENIAGYKDSTIKINECKFAIADIQYNAGLSLIKEGKYDDAIAMLESLGEHRDSKEKINECNLAKLDIKYKEAVALMEEGKYEAAIAIFRGLAGYSDSSIKIIECNNKILNISYNKALALMEEGKYEAATDAFTQLGAYLDSKYQIIECKYRKAAALLENSSYDTAMNMFKELGNYKDSVTQITECVYQKAISFMNFGKNLDAMHLFRTIETYKDSATKATDAYNKIKINKNAKVGDVVYFGFYEQDNNTANGKELIEWVVLEVKSGKALVISKHILDFQVYHTTDKDITWAKCSLRTWLNGTFLDAAFSSNDKSQIAKVTVKAHENPESSMLTSPGSSTKDKVFLLSVTEYNKYFKSQSAWVCKTTRYASAQSSGIIGEYARSCWLRSPGYFQNDAAYVSSDGSIGCYGIITLKDGVRPAMWIDLSKVG